MKSKVILFSAFLLLAGNAIASVEFVAGSSVTVFDSPLLDNTDKLTLSAWIYPTATNSNARAIMSKRVSAGNQYAYGFFMFTSNRIFFDMGNSPTYTSSTRLTGTSTMTANRWHYVTAVYDGTLADDTQRMKIYVNGVRDPATVSYGTTAIGNLSSNFFAGTLGGASSSFLGYIDDLRVYIGRAFTPADAKYFFDCRCRPNDTDYLALYMPLNTGQDGVGLAGTGPTVLDMGPNRLNGYPGSGSHLWSGISPLSIPGD